MSQVRQVRRENFGREIREGKTKKITLSQVLMEMRELSVGVEKYSSPCLHNTKFEILINNQRISQVGNYIYSSGIQE